MSQTNWNDFTPVDDKGAPIKPATVDSGTNWDDFTPAPEPAGLLRKAGDLGLSVAKGVVSVPEAAVGIADIPTGGRVGKFLENEGGAFGFRPKQAKEYLSSLQSDDLQSKQKQFQQADGVLDKAGVALSNPSLVANAVAESVPLMGAGAVPARALLAAAPRVGAAAAGAIGEGVVGAGSAAEAIRQETPDGLLTPTQSGLAAATGATTSAFGFAGGKVAQRLGIGDVDTMFAQGAARAAGAPSAKSIPRQVVEGAIAEGWLEELPQSVSEQVLQNLSLNKPWHEGVSDAAVMGTLAGMAMGGGAAGVAGFSQPTPEQTPPPNQPAPVPPPVAGPTLALAGPDRGVIQVAGDGTARTPAYQAPGYVGDVTDVEPRAVNPVREQVAAAAEQGGALSSAALTAIDTGLSDAMQPAPEQAPPQISLEEADARDRAAYEQFFAGFDADPVVSRYFENDDDIPDFDAASNASEEDFLRALGATDEDIQDAIATSSQSAIPQSSAASNAGPQAYEPAGPREGAGEGAASQAGQVNAGAIQQAAPDAPANLRDALVRVRQQKQEAANAQAAKAPAPAAAPVPGSTATAVEAAGVERSKLLASLDQTGATREMVLDTRLKDAQFRLSQAAASPNINRADQEAEVRSLNQEIADLNSVRDQARELDERDRREGNTRSMLQGARQELDAAVRAGTVTPEAAQSIAAGAKKTGNAADAAEAVFTAVDSAAAAAGPAPDIKAITAKQIPDMTDAELQAAIEHYGPAHKRTAKLQKEAQRRAVPATTTPTTTQGNADGPQASQAQQASPKPTQAAAAPAAAAAGLTDGAPTANTGAQAAPAPGPQAAAPAESRQQRTQRVAAAGEAWTRMPTVEREAMAGRADGLNPMQRKNVPRAAWADLSSDIRRKLADVMGTSVNTAQGAINTEANQAAELTLDDQLKQVNDQLANQGAVQNANTRAKRDQIRTAIAERDFPAILKAVDGDVGSAEAINQALQFAGDEPKAKVIERVLKNRGISSEYRQRWAERLMDGQVDELDAEMQSYEDRATVNLRGKAAGDMLEMGNGTLYRIAGIDTAANRIRLVRNPDQLSERTVLVDQDGYNKLVADHEQTMAEAAATPVAPTPAKAQETPAKASGKKKPSADQTRAKADLMAALADLGDILGKNTRMNIMPEQEQKLLPVLTRLLDAAFRLGYHKFKDSAKFALDQIRANLGDDAADALTLDHLQGAYIAMAGGKQNADTKRAVIDVETKADIEAHEAVSVDDEETADTTTAEDNQEQSDAGTAIRRDGAEPLGEVAAQDDRGATPGGDAEPRGATGQQAGGQPGGQSDAGGDAEARSGGNGAPGPDSAETGARTRGGRGRVTGSSTAKSRRAAKPSTQELRDEATEEIKQASPVNVPGIDFTITDEVELGKGSESVKFADNLAAIRTLKLIEQENRRATPEEQRTLARYVGWGGLKNAFRVAGAKDTEGVAKGWETRVAEVEALLTPAELRAARNSTTAAHYTSQSVVQAVWKAVERLGFRGGAVLEPSVGTGNFLGLMPAALRGTSKTLAVEYDSITARIAQQLYPNQSILHSGFQDVPLPDNKFALAIGNPPFGREGLYFRHNPSINGKSIHNQFFLQSVQSLEADGLMGMVVSHYLMDAMDYSARLDMAVQAEFLGAVRLPDTAFKENARTEVVTDIVLFRKRSATERDYADKAAQLLRSGGMRRAEILDGYSTEAVAQVDAILGEMNRWVPSSKQENFAGSGEAINVNPYFLSNPGQVVGTMDASGTMNGRAGLNVKLADPDTFVQRLNQAIENLPTRDPVDAVAQRTMEQFELMATGMRLAVNRAEPGAVTRTAEGQLKVVVEMDDPAQSRKTILNEIVLTAETPFSEEYTLRTDGKWQREEDVIGADGKPVKKTKKDGSPSNLNEKKIAVYDSLSAIPDKDKWGKERIAVITDMLPVRDAIKRQLVLESSDAPAAMIEANRKRLNDAYAAFKEKHGELHKASTIKVAMTMPDGALALAVEEVAKDGTISLAAIMQRRVTVPPKPVESVKSAGEAVAVVLAESGQIDIERVAKLLGTDTAGAEAALSEGDNPRAFFDPETGNWEPADGYLSGLVRRKLLAAKASGLEKNVAALEKVQPEQWDATQITPNLGSAWIPGEVYAAFLKHLGFSTSSVTYSKATNTFSVVVKGSAKPEWTPSQSALPTSEIVERTLNSKPVKVTYKDSDGKTHVDEEGTLESQMKATEIANEFLDWAFSDDARRDQLVEIFNEKFNTRVVRQRDGSHLTLPGKVPDTVVKMRPWQLNAVWRGITDRAVLYDHAVGAGKTYTAIARAMERRRMGLSKKPMIVVPNHLVEQWAADVKKLYPGANVLAAGKEDFEKLRRRRLFARIGSGDYDMVIVGHSSFGFIDIDPATEQRYLDEELRIAYAAVKEAEEAAAESGFSGWGKPMGVAEAERLVKKLEERLAKVRDSKRDRLLTFEEMGIDDLTIDEAHEFKNLAYSSNLQGTAGMGNKAGSAKAMDVNLKLRSLNERPGTSVAFLTGTPISNSVAEMYLVLKNLVPNELRDLGMENFDAWRTTFVSASSAYEPTESGSLKEVTRLGREWMNMKSLMDLYYSVADAVTLQDMKDDFARVNPGKSFPVPKVRSQIAGDGDRAMVAVKPNAAQRAILRDIVGGFEGLQGIKNLKERNAERLRLMDRARKVSLDARAVDPNASVPDGTGKIGAVVDNVFARYEKWADDLGTQIIFLDRSVPKTKGDDKVIAAYDKLVADMAKATDKGDEKEIAKITEKLEAYNPREIEELRNAQNGGWNAYDDIKRQLVAKGIPANEIRFVQEANTDKQKADLFAKVKSGEVRVLIGSTPRMGAGTNVQDRLVALHHVDVTWKPSDIEQREGRIVRQGNLLLNKYGEDFTVDVIAYATEMTVDAKMWSLNATKLKAINGIRKYDGSFQMEFDDEESASMAEMAALATGNPLMVERVTLDGDIKKLEMAQRSFNRRQNGVRGQISQAERAIKQGPAQAKRLRAFAQEMDEKLSAVRERSKARRVTINGKEFASAEEAELAAIQSIEQQQEQSDGGKGRYVVEVNGEKATSRDRISTLIRESVGDPNFEAEINGVKVIDHSSAVRAIMELHGPASGRGREFTLDGISINGMKVELDVAPSRWKPQTDSVLTMVILDREGKPVATREHGYESPVLSSNSMRAGLQKLLKDFAPQLYTGDADQQERITARAERDLPDLKLQAEKTFPQLQELTQKRERLQQVVAELKASSDVARIDDSSDGAAFSRGQGLSAEEAVAMFNAANQVSPDARNAQRRISDARLVATQQLIDGIKEKWARAPEIIVARNMQDAQIPQEVRDYDALLKSQGATGEPRGFIYKGKVYLLSDELSGPVQIAEVLFHEVLGHYGLRGAFGDGLKPILQQIGTMRRRDVLAKAREYGMVAKGLSDADTWAAMSEQDRLSAAEEVLAEMAQSTPEIGFVQRAIAAIRTWLRANVPGFKNLKLTDADIVQAYILPARGYVTRSQETGAQSLERAMRDAGFSRTDDRINFSRTTEAAKAVGDAIKSVTVTNIKQRAGFKLTDYLGIGLQALGRRQIVDIYGDMLPLGEYNRLVQQMEADKNEGGAEADQLVTRWAKLSDEGKLANLMHDATLAQIDPAKPYVDGDDKARYMTLQGRFNALTDAAKQVYTDTRDSYQAHHAKVRSAIKERIERSEIKGERKAALLKQMDDEFFKAIKGVYFPLARFGQYAVTVKGPDGKVESVSRAETKAEAEALRNNLLSAFPRDKGFTVGRVMLSKDFIADRDAVGRGFMTELYQVLDQQNMDAAQRAELEDTLGQLYLSSLPDLSWAKHGIHRKGTPGFSQDARRAFAQNMFHGARYLAKLRYSDLMQDELAAMQKHVDDWREVEDFDQNSAQRVVDEMNKRHESLMNPKSNPLSTALTSLGFVFHLGLSPASAMVNLSQTALVAYPIMGAKWGFNKANAALLKASAEAAKGKNDITGSLNADELAAYNEAVRAGTIDVTMAHDLAGIAQGEDAGVMWKIRPVMRWASFLFHHAERFNRQVTFVAAYRLAREAGADHKAAFEQATKATYDGHFDYGAANRPRIMQGNVAKVLLLFKQYGQNMVYTLARNAQQSIKGESPEARAQARKALAGLLAAHAAAAGVLGLPMVTTLLAAASMIGGDDDEPWDAKVALQNMLADTLGQKPAEVLAHGLSRLTPWDISGRVGLDKLIFPDVQEGLEGQRLAESAMAAALGPVAGIGVNVLKGAQHMSEGRYAMGLEAMLPSALRGPVKALRYAEEGVQDKSGISILDEVSPAAVAGQALGFSPSAARNAQEGKSAIMAHDRALGERRQELLAKIARATMAKDEEAKAEAREEIRRFNEKNPSRRINPNHIMASVHGRQKRIDQAEDGVYLPRNRRDAMDAGRFANAD